MYYELNGNILPQVRLVDRAVLEPPYIHRKRRPDEYILYIMKRGVLYLKEDGRRYELREGDVLLLDKDFVHQGIQASECEYYYIHFRHPQFYRRDEEQGFAEKLMEERSESLQQDASSYDLYERNRMWFPKFTKLQNRSCYLRILRLVQEAAQQNRNQMEYYKVNCQCRIMEAMVEISRAALSSMAEGREPGISLSYQRIHELLNYLNANYHRPISGAGIEEEFSCNFDYLNRVFKKNTGKTIFAYLTDVRMKHAMELLESTSMKISAVGYRVGIGDEGYFCKVFKKHTGMTPGQYGKMAALRHGKPQSSWSTSGNASG